MVTVRQARKSYGHFPDDILLLPKAREYDLRIRVLGINSYKFRALGLVSLVVVR